jgi:hypothetical protein
MFARASGIEDRRAARRRELVALYAQEARIKHRIAQIVREAEDEGDWEAAGCASSTHWLAQLSHSEHQTAGKLQRTSDALRVLPALDQALAQGELSLDQVAAAAKYTTPASDALVAQMAVGRAPSEIGLIARKLAPPTVVDDDALRRRRMLAMTWTRGRRELAIKGRLPLELGVQFEQAVRDAAKAQRAADRRDGLPEATWQQSSADALVRLVARQGGAVRAPRATLIVHVGDSAPPQLEGAGPISPETAERLACDARRLTIKREGADLVHSRVGRCASYVQQRALARRSTFCQYPGCTLARELEAHHILPVARGGRTELANLILLCSRHHKLLHDRHIDTGGTGDRPVFTDATGREITASQPHAPPARE